jgi:hypothetical protein
MRARTFGHCDRQSTARGSVSIIRRGCPQRPPILTRSSCKNIHLSSDVANSPVPCLLPPWLIGGPVGVVRIPPDLVGGLSGVSPRTYMFDHHRAVASVLLSSSARRAPRFAPTILRLRSSGPQKEVYTHD